MTRGSREGNRAGRAGRGLRVKVYLLIFKEEKTKGAVTYHLWQWNVAIFCHSGWDDQHLLPYIFQSLQGFLGDLARSLGEDTTITDVLQMLTEHYGMVMTFDTFSKGSIPSSKVPGRMWLNLEYACHSRSRYSSWVPGKDSTGTCRGDEIRSVLQGP